MDEQERVESMGHMERCEWLRRWGHDLMDSIQMHRDELRTYVAAKGGAQAVAVETFAFMLEYSLSPLPSWFDEWSKRMVVGALAASIERTIAQPEAV